jgi:hypothetical protein
LVMAWSPPAHSAGIVWVSAPGDYATFNSNHTPDGTEIQHIRGLGFIGLLASGSHHQHHHLAIAKGEFDHEHLGQTH